jgi:hypothetical protein
VRRIVLAGTAPEGAPDIHRWSDDVYTHACADEITPEHALNVFFSGSEESRAKGIEYLQRTQARQVDRDEPTDLATRDAQLAAITAWGYRTHRSSTASPQSFSRPSSPAATTTR